MRGDGADGDDDADASRRARDERAVESRARDARRETAARRRTTRDARVRGARWRDGSDATRRATTTRGGERRDVERRSTSRGEAMTTRDVARDARARRAETTMEGEGGCACDGDADDERAGRAHGVDRAEDAAEGGGEREGGDVSLGG